MFAPALTTPALGLLADKLRRRKAVALAAMAASIALLVLLALPRVGCFGCFANLLLLSTALSCLTLGGFVDAYTLDLLGRAPGRGGSNPDQTTWLAAAIPAAHAYTCACVRVQPNGPPSTADTGCGARSGSPPRP